MSRAGMYWVIIVGSVPTSFRARDKEILLPTLHQLQRKQADVVLRFFDGSRFFESEEQAGFKREQRDQFRKERKGGAWRPGGDHKDPRAKYELTRDQRRARFKERSFQGPKVQGSKGPEVPQGPGDPANPVEPVRPANPTSPVNPVVPTRPVSPAARKPWAGKKSFGDRVAKPWADKKPFGERKPWSGGPKKFGAGPPRGDRKPPGDRTPFGERKPFGDREAKPWTEKKPFGERKPWSGGPKKFGAGPRKPWTGPRRGPSGPRGPRGPKS